MARLSSNEGRNYGQEDGKQIVPGWSAFNAYVSRDELPMRPSVVGYLPVIPASPNELSTVYLLLNRSLAVADELGQHVVIVVYQAIYAKAQEIVCKHRDESSRVVLRIAEFHTACTLLAVTGKSFMDAGPHDILVESGLVGPNAVCAVLAGKHYNRAMRSHKIVLEALFRLRWNAFEIWRPEEQTESTISQNEEEDLLEALGELRIEKSNKSLTKLLHLSAFDSVYEAFAKFTCHQQRALDFYIDMVSLSSPVCAGKP